MKIEVSIKVIKRMEKKVAMVNYYIQMVKLIKGIEYLMKFMGMGLFIFLMVRYF